MGSSASKAAKTSSKLSASNTARRYPTRSPPPSSTRTNVQPPRPSPESEVKMGPTVHPEATIAETRNPSIDFDSADPDLPLQARLRSLGPVQPNPTFSNSSTYNFARSAPLSHSDVFARSSTYTSPTNPQSQSQPSPTTTTTTITTFSSSSSSPHDPNLTPTSFQPSFSNPSQSIFPSQTQALGERENPAVSLLTARSRLAEEADAEFAGLGKKGSQGRSFIDVQTLRQVLVLRGEGMAEGKIEERFGLRRGVVGKLGVRVVGVGS